MGLEKPLWLLPLLSESDQGVPATPWPDNPPEVWTPPPPVQPFRPIGRADVISRALLHLRPANTRHLKTAAVVGLWGEAGMGKATIARWIAHFLKPDYPDACLVGQWPSSQPQPTHSRLLEGWLRQLGWAEHQIPTSLPEQIAFWQSCLIRQRLMIWLEVDGDPQAIATLVPQTANCAMILTSRHPLPGLPQSIALELSPLSLTDSVALLAEAAGRPQTASQLALWAPLAELCEGVPLALELAGGQLQSVPEPGLTQAIALQVRSGQQQPSIYPKHRAVASSFSQICQTLSVPAQTILYRASLSPTPLLTRGLAACLLQTAPPEPGADLPQTAAIALQELVNRQCLSPYGSGYRIRHDLIRFLAKAQLASLETRDQRQQLRLTISRWYGQQLQQFCRQRHPQTLLGISPETPTPPPAVDPWLDAHWQNLLAAWDWALQAGAWDLYLEMGLGLATLLTTALAGDWWPPHQQQLLAIAQAQGQAAIAAGCLNNVANAYARLGRLAEAEAYYEQSLSHLQAPAAYRQAAQVLANLGRLRGLQGQPEIQRQLWQQALEQLAPDPDLQGAIQAWMALSEPKLTASPADGLQAPAAASSGNPLQWLVRKLFT